MADLPPNSVALYRICTEKSVLGFGRYRDLTVGDIIIMDASYIAYVYYTCSKVSFHKDILDLLKLTPIEKPGKNQELFEAWKKEYYAGLPFTEEERKHYFFKKKQAEKRRAAKKLERVERYENYTTNKGWLQSINHGHTKLK